MKYGIGKAPRSSDDMNKMRFDKTYRSIVNARRDAYRKAIDGYIGDTIYIYQISDRGYLTQIGFCYRTIVQKNMKVDSKKPSVIFENMNSGPRHIWYLNKDGTLGNKRF